MALRELRPTRTEDQRHVRVERLVVVAERAPQRQHAVRRVDEVLAPQHVRDVHLEVVDRVGEEEHRRAVRAHDDEIGDRRPLDRHLAADDVGERAAALVGRAEADRDRTTLFPPLRSFVRSQIAATSVVTRRTTIAHRLLVALLDLGLGAVALVRELLVDHPRRRGEVRVEARALEIRALVPLEPEPVHHVLDLVDRLLRRPRDVGVLDAEDERALHVARVQPVVERGADAPDVQESGRRGRKTEAGSGHDVSLRGAVSRSRRVGSGSCPRRSA